MKRNKLLSMALSAALTVSLLVVPAGAASVIESIPCRYDGAGDFSEGYA